MTLLEYFKNANSCSGHPVHPHEDRTINQEGDERSLDPGHPGHHLPTLQYTQVSWTLVILVIIFLLCNTTR